MESKIQNSKSNSKTQEYLTPKLIYSFKVASYDRTKDLVIDPLLASTYLGGTSFDYGFFLALDASGNVYVTGQTSSTNFPTTGGAYDTSFNGGVWDAFVSKLNGGLTSLLASTYLGGSSDDYGFYHALDASGNVYVTGQTSSTNYPTTNEAYDTSYNGGSQDVFVSRLDSNLSGVITVSIDIKPGSYPNSINPRSHGKIPVAILTTDTFDATLPSHYDASDIVVETVVCAGAQAIDGRTDGSDRFVATFNIQDLVLEIDSKKEKVVLTVSGELEDGTKFEGSDTVKVKGKEKDK